MVKVPRNINLEQDINTKLSTVDNASFLIETLLRTHFDLSILEAKPSDTPEELEQKETVLQGKIDELNTQKKDLVMNEEIKEKLRKIGIDNQFLIDKIKRYKQPPNIFGVKHLCEEYHLKTEQIFDSFKILRPEWQA